eukprot:CAMPEP_0184503262 /NCGR_PEP_ID=MMETSP0113_2-20130426/51789_1 /TAXON_ID=91329 /ORGANISM="Norrisiella sphaerica, Strain BC52" /LENGTH=468 /DNA_ID=CAMNT_0026892729 /DNA_START=567 /DNA_END=1973 /DNA_ORIENTATION=+
MADCVGFSSDGIECDFKKTSTCDKQREWNTFSYRVKIPAYVSANGDCPQASEVVDTSTLLQGFGAELSLLDCKALCAGDSRCLGFSFQSSGSNQCILRSGLCTVGTPSSYTFYYKPRATNSPTVSPTVSPTARPTARPTTSVPSATPTTLIPSAAPTFATTSTPSATPTTLNPTTPQPTLSPSFSPTLTPTRCPTFDAAAIVTSDFVVTLPALNVIDFPPGPKRDDLYDAVRKVMSAINGIKAIVDLRIEAGSLKILGNIYSYPEDTDFVAAQLQDPLVVENVFSNSYGFNNTLYGSPSSVVISPSMSSSSSSKENNDAELIGILVALVICAILAFIAVIFCCRYRSRRERYQKTVQRTANIDVGANSGTINVEKGLNTEPNMGSMKLEKESNLEPGIASIQLGKRSMTGLKKASISEPEKPSYLRPEMGPSQLEKESNLEPKMGSVQLATEADLGSENVETKLMGRT